MFSINPAYDMEAPDTDIEALMEFKGMERSGLVADEARQKLYSACENRGVAITVMKALGAGTLLKAESSPFGVAMTVPQCIQYCLDRSGVKVVLVGAAPPRNCWKPCAISSFPPRSAAMPISFLPASLFP